MLKLLICRKFGIIMVIIKRILRTIAWVLLFVVLSFIGFIVYISLTDYQPQPIEIIVEKQDNVEKLEKDTFSIINWNIGYAGLGKEMDFFYDGGKGVRPTKDLMEKYLSNILGFIKNNDTVDFWLVQEIDIKAKRSYQVNEVEEIISTKDGSYGVFAKNYLCQYVPIPVNDPMGYVEAGLMTFSDFPPSEAVRHAYPLIASWPDKLFLLDRCFLLNRYPLENGHDLVIINTHNSAYVYDSILRIEELEILKKVMLHEYSNGNYVVAGGDWNQNPPGYKPSKNYNGHRFKPSQVKMNNDFMPKGWQWIFDESAPTNRSNDKPFVIGENETTCLDYYLLSPNVSSISTKVIDLKFEYSDHNPIYLRAQLNH